MSILLTIVILACVCWFVFWLCDHITVLPPMIGAIIKAIVSILVIIHVLKLVGISF